MADDAIPPVPEDDEIERRLQAALERAKGMSGGGEDEDAHDLEAARLERLEAEIDAGSGWNLPTVEESSLDGKLGEVEHRVREATTRREAAAAQADRIRKADQESARGAGIGLTAAYALMGLPLAGAGIGWALNKATGGNAWLPIFALAGMIGGIWWVVRLTNMHDKK